VSINYLVDTRLYKYEIASPPKGGLAMMLRIMMYSVEKTPFGEYEEF